MLAGERWLAPKQDHKAAASRLASDDVKRCCPGNAHLRVDLDPFRVGGVLGIYLEGGLVGHLHANAGLALRRLGLVATVLAQRPPSVAVAISVNAKQCINFFSPAVAPAGKRASMASRAVQNNVKRLISCIIAQCPSQDPAALQLN